MSNGEMTTKPTLETVLERINELDAEQERRFNALEKRYEVQEKRLEALEKRMTVHAVSLTSDCSRRREAVYLSSDNSRTQMFR